MTVFETSIQGDTITLSKCAGPFALPVSQMDMTDVEAYIVITQLKAMIKQARKNKREGTGKEVKDK